MAFSDGIKLFSTDPLEDVIIRHKIVLDLKHLVWDNEIEVVLSRNKVEVYLDFYCM